MWSAGIFRPLWRVDASRGKEKQKNNIPMSLIGLGILLTLRLKKSEFIISFLSEGERKQVRILQWVGY
jgi:hypothetical protein